MNDKVVVTRPLLGLCHMQVCAENDATDEEILRTCNTKNPAGTSQGWCRVLRADEDWLGEMIGAPVQCDDDPNRTHFLVVC